MLALKERAVAAALITWQCLMNLDDTMVMKLQATVVLTMVWPTNPTTVNTRPDRIAHHLTHTHVLTTP